MTVRYLLLAVVFSAFVLTACSEPRRTPDGHLMDRPKVSAYGPDDITKHDMDASDDESVEDEE
jgi:hypothetical protein